MSLKQARQIAAYARKRGLKPQITHNRPACNMHNPGRHGMCGDCVVVATRPVGGMTAAGYLWSKADVDAVFAGERVPA